MQSEFLTPTELKRRLRFKTLKEFWSFVSEQRIPRIQLTAHSVVFPRAEIDRWLVGRYPESSQTQLGVEQQRRQSRDVACDELLDATKLARELGVSTWLTKASKRAAAHYGDTPWTGRYTTKDRFLAWLERHPDFVANHWLRTTA